MDFRNTNFKTKPRCIGEFAKSQYKESRELQKAFSNDSNYVADRIAAQKGIKIVLHQYNMGLLTSREALKMLIQMV